MKINFRQKSHINFRTQEDKYKYFRKEEDKMSYIKVDTDIYNKMVEIADDFRKNPETYLTENDYYELFADFVVSQCDATASDEEKQEAIDDFYTKFYRLILEYKL